jgi:hypothetical protein
VTDSRNGQRQGRPEVPGANVAYVMVVGGLVKCRRCAALLQDTRPDREQHDSFHAALRRLWDLVESRS